MCNSYILRLPKKRRYVMKKAKTIWCYLDGKKHCDVVQWALGANMTVVEAKKALMKMYPIHKVTFEVGQEV